MTKKAIHPRSGRIVSPEEFNALEGSNHRDRGVWPRCPACGENLFVHGAHSMKVASRFRHAKGSACPLSSTPDPRFEHLVPSAWDPEGERRLKRRFCETRNLKQAYAVCHRLCGRLSSDEFLDLCRRAARLGVFRYRDLPLWALPWILVTLNDFPQTDGRRSYGFRFVLRKPERSVIDATWLEPEKCRLEKVFADSGRPVRGGCYRVGEEAMEAARNDTGWIGDGLLRRLRECCRRLGVHD